uniref:Uncharacterized protein n=1 Tax=Avena sativa TaxID=4498 RepID=A0ACD5W7X9_AVESA
MRLSGINKQSLETKIYSYQEAYITMDRSKLIMLLMVILPCIIMYSQAQTTDVVDSNKIQVCICVKLDPPCPDNKCFCCELEPDRCARTREECPKNCGSACRSLDANFPRPLLLP